MGFYPHASIVPRGRVSKVTRRANGRHGVTRGTYGSTVTIEAQTRMYQRWQETGAW